MTINPPAVRAQKLGLQLVTALQKRHFEAYFCADEKEALSKALELIPPQDVVSWGGSSSIKEIGILEALSKRNQPVVDRDTASSPLERQELMRRALLCDTFLMGANAVSQDGQLVNIDANGNRTAALMYGPKQVIVFVGINKLAHKLEDAVIRARTVAAPTNAQRFTDNKTPCLMTGACADCTAADSICAHLVITRLCRPAGRIKVIVVGKPLGY
uniref:LUD domain-containing protein n=1 Tax=uncultured Elusimicrobia bacterium TaxID=699876 RepID=A0A650ENZ5_9BACT|nr:hypothetical protein Elusimicrob1349_0640 [uncultured Elusimicrobia bacterium]